MSNTIVTMVDYSTKLDEVYRKESLTSILDSDPLLVTHNGKEFKIPQMDLSGLANHDRTNGGEYVAGGATLNFITKEPDYDRNRIFTVDVMDNAESAGLAFGQLSGQFIKHNVVPEIDSVRFSKYASVAGTKKSKAIVDGKDFLAELIKANEALDNAEVSSENRILYATPALLNSIMGLQTIESREVLSTFSQVIKVPQSRFYGEISLLDGKTSGQEAGGYVRKPVTYALTTDTALDGNKMYYTRTGSEGAYVYTAVATPDVEDIATYYEAKGGIELNFLIIQKDAIIQSLKHVAPKYIAYANNQRYDGDSYAYRVYGIADFYNRKVKGIYAHKKA